MGSLSQLPEDIICHILYYLTNRQLIQLSLVSKELFNIVQNRPALVLIQTSSYHERHYILRNLKRYQEQSIHLESFAYGPAKPFVMDKFFINEFIELAIKKSLRKLSLSLPEFHVLPKPVFEVESLVELSLRNCVLEPERVVWPNLKRLCLRRVRFDKGVFETMMRGCPLIETLEMTLCLSKISYIEIKVANLFNLRELDIGHVKTLQVNAVPNLNSMHSRGGELELSSSEYKNLRSLSLDQDTEIVDDIFINFPHKFPRLEYLSLEPNNTMDNMFISSPSLKVIKMSDKYRSLQRAWFDVPNLVLFDYCNTVLSNLDRTDCAFLPQLSFKRNSGGWKSRIKLMEHKISANHSWFLKLRNFLAAFGKSEISVTAEFGNNVKFIDATEMLARSASFPRTVSGVREFSVLTCWEVFDVSSAHSILIGILKICRPERIIFRPWRDSDFQSRPRHNFKYLWDATDEDDIAICNKFVEVLETQEEELFTVIFNMEYL